MKREYSDSLRDMLENAQRAIQFTKGMSYDAFAKDDKTVYAVIRAVEIIGEAAANILKKSAPNTQTFRGGKSRGCETNLCINILESTWKLSGRQSMKICPC